MEPLKYESCLGMSSETPARHAHCRAEPGSGPCRDLESGELANRRAEYPDSAATAVSDNLRGEAAARLPPDDSLLVGLQGPSEESSTVVPEVVGVEADSM